MPAPVLSGLRGPFSEHVTAENHYGAIAVCFPRGTRNVYSAALQEFR
jgi:hypothetical protein